MNDIIFVKVRDVKTPSQAYNFPAGTDFYVPTYSNEFYTDLVSKNPNRDFYSLSVSSDCKSMTITLNPGGRIIIPGGIKIDIRDKNTCLLASDKSGVSSKKGITHLAGLIDADYHGELLYVLLNTGTEQVSFSTDEKIIQFIHLPVIYSKYNEVDESEFSKLVSKTDRGENGFGSSSSV